MVQNGHMMVWPDGLNLLPLEGALLKPHSKATHPVLACREERNPSPWRNRPVEESLKLFEDMRAGLIDEGKACLRWAAQLSHNVPVMSLQVQVSRRPCLASEISGFSRSL